MANWDLFGGRSASGGNRTNPGNPAPNVPPVTNGGGNGQNVQQLVQQFLQGKPPGTETLQQLKTYLAQQGINIEIPTRAGGQLSSDKIVLPDQSVIDLYGDVGGANTPQWAADGYWVGGRPSSTPGTWSDPNAGEMGGGGPGGVSLNPMSNVAPFTAPGLLAPYTQEASYNSNDIINSPEYQNILKRGMEAVQQSAAGEGTLKTGGTLKGLSDYAQGSMTSHISDILNRQLGVMGFNRGTLWGNQDNAYSKLYGTANIGLSAASSFANNTSGLITGQANANAQNTMNQGQNVGDLVGLGSDLFGGWFNQRQNRGKS